MDYGHEKSDKLLKKLEKRLDSEYRQASKEVKQKLDDYWAKFEIKDRAKRAERDAGKVTPYVRKYANMNGITDITQKTIDDAYNYWRKGQIMVGARWNEMSDIIAQDFHNVNNIAGAMIRDHSYDVYALNHNYGTFEIEKGSLVNTSYSLYDKSTVERLVRDNPDLLPPPGKKVSQRIREGKDILWNKQLIQSSMTQSILQGESIPKIAKRLAESVGDSNRKAAIRNARTMTTGAENAGRVDSYKRAERMGIKMKQVWLATLDGRTRDSHRDLDGEKIEVGGKFSNGCRFPGDPQGRAEEVYNCRCTLIAEVDGVDMNVSDTAERNSKLGGMSYEEWKAAKTPKQFIVNVQPEQLTIGTAKTVDDVNKYMNGQEWFASGKVDLTGCDIDSAKSIASAYQQVFDKFPNLKGRINAPDAKPVGMSKNTYAWCYTRTGGKVQVNPDIYNNWQKVVDSYNRDVLNGFHPKGTTAESIVTHEIGHAIDGLLAQERVLGGYTKSGEFRYASSSMKTTVMNRASKKDDDLLEALNMWSWDKKRSSAYAVSEYVSEYATKNPREWFAECFAEYITSANPRVVAREFGAELEKLTRRLP